MRTPTQIIKVVRVHFGKKTPRFGFLVVLKMVPSYLAAAHVCPDDRTTHSCSEMVLTHFVSEVLPEPSMVPQPPQVQESGAGLRQRLFTDQLFLLRAEASTGLLLGTQSLALSGCLPLQRTLTLRAEQQRGCGCNICSSGCYSKAISFFFYIS